MRVTVDHVVHRTVPAVDGAVVHAQLCQFGDGPRLELFEGVVVGDHRQQRREVSGVLLEEVENRCDPTLSEPHARTDALIDEFLWPGVGGLLEHRDAAFMPECPARQERRIACQCHLDTCDGLCRVPVICEILRCHPQMQLQ